MPFGREYRRFATLSFPSKLVEYCAVGRPIVVWGPVYASAVQWALRTGAAVTVTDSDPRALLARLDALRSNPGERRELARRARGHYDVQFRPDIIQRQFEDSLMSLLDKHTAMRA
jgi:glycosyltransferase involved in cell wall biosynthesis